MRASFGHELLSLLAEARVLDVARDGQAAPALLLDVAAGLGGVGRLVAVPHRAVLNFLASMATTPGLTATDVVVAVTTLSFDIAGLELWLPLTVGARVAIASRAEASDGQLLQARLASAGADGRQASPGVGGVRSRRAPT